MVQCMDSTSASIDKLKVDSAAPYKYEYLAALAVIVGSSYRKRRANDVIVRVCDVLKSRPHNWTPKLVDRFFRGLARKENCIFYQNLQLTYRPRQDYPYSMSLFPTKVERIFFSTNTRQNTCHRHHHHVCSSGFLLFFTRQPRPRQRAWRGDPYPRMGWGLILGQWIPAMHHTAPKSSMRLPLTTQTPSTCCLLQSAARTSGSLPQRTMPLKIAHFFRN